MRMKNFLAIFLMAILAFALAGQVQAAPGMAEARVMIFTAGRLPVWLAPGQAGGTGMARRDRAFDEDEMRDCDIRPLASTVLRFNLERPEPVSFGLTQELPFKAGDGHCDLCRLGTIGRFALAGDRLSGTVSCTLLTDVATLDDGSAARTNQPVSQAVRAAVDGALPSGGWLCLDMGVSGTRHVLAMVVREEEVEVVPHDVVPEG
jgi:hypothetical protein